MKHPALFDLRPLHKPCVQETVFVLQFNVSKTINIIVCVEMVPWACCRRLLVYRTVLTVCVCSKPCDRTQVTDNGVSSSSSFLFIQPLTFPPPPYALQLFLFSFVYFPSKMLAQMQSCTHFTSTHYNAGVFTFPAQHYRQHSTADMEKHCSNKEL